MRCRGCGYRIGLSRDNLWYHMGKERVNAMPLPCWNNAQPDPLASLVEAELAAKAGCQNGRG